MPTRPMPLFQSNPKPRRRPLISLTPLIDMVFILLVFFMLASSFQTWRAIPIAAASRAVGGAGPQGALLVQVRADGLRFGGHAMTLEAVAAQVAADLAQQPSRRILIEPAAGIPLQAAVTVLDRLAAAGARNLSLVGGAAP